jgi:hypothetical protein
MTQENETRQLYVKSLLPTGLGFGLVVDDGEDAVIPPHVTREGGFEEKDTLSVILAPNTAGNKQQRIAVPWQVVRVVEVVTYG